MSTRLLANPDICEAPNPWALIVSDRLGKKARQMGEVGYTINILTDDLPDNY
jgi:hypothetical protein